MWLPDLNALGQPTVFMSQSGSTATSNTLGTVWVKPPGISWIYVNIIGAAGGGGGGAGQVAAADTGGGGGGAAGASVRFLMPAAFVPDSLYFSIGAGTPGGTGGSAASGAAAATAGTTRIHAPDGLVLLAMNGGGGGGGGTAAAGGAGGASGTTPTASPWLSCGFFVIWQGGTGSIGGRGADGDPSAPATSTPGSGGGGPRLDGERAGGAQSAVFGYPAVPGGTVTTTPSGRVVNNPPFAPRGGPGGAGIFGATPGQRGADGWFGCGGGGGGGCTGIAGATGGDGGRGGDGIAWLWSW